MRFRFLPPLAACALPTLAFAGGTITWPLPDTPPGGNSAAVAAPKIDWVQQFQGNLDKAQKMPKIDLIFDGDSITQLYPINGGALWHSRYDTLNVFDFGISGDRTQHVLWRLQNGQVDNLHPKLIVLMIGTNNLGDNTPEQIAEGTKAIIDEYQKHCPDAVILLQGIFARGFTAADPNRGKAQAVNQLLPPLADGKKVIFLDFSDKFIQPDGTVTKDILSDGVHPTAKGYQIWADSIQPTIDQFFPGQSAH